MRTDDVKVGMKVRIKDHWVSRSDSHALKMDRWLGQTMTVAHIDSFTNDIKMIEDADENAGLGWSWCAEDFDPVIETDSESVALSIKSLCDAVKTLNDDDLETLHAVVEVESECRNEQRQRRLAGKIVFAMDAYLTQTGNERNIYLNGVCGTASMQRIRDAIVDEFDLNAALRGN